MDLEMKKIEIYTAITNDKDEPRDDIKVFSDYSRFIKPVLNAKIYKVLAHKYVDADYSIWVDGNIYFKTTPEVIVNEFLGESDIAVWKHFGRDCLYAEAKVLSSLGTEVVPDVKRQVAHYREEGFPEHQGLGECNVIVRKHSPKVEAFNNAWWAEICRHSTRDQISFPYVVSKFPELKVNYVNGDPRDHKYFKYNFHKSYPPRVYPK
jgi:hypothetical protein